MVAGFQVPGMVGVFVELTGNVGGVEFRQRGPIWVKVGFVCGLIRMVIEVVE